jgi:ribosomal protein S18 acetylase RimI-like enzyme
MAAEIRRANPDDIDTLIDLVGAYHRFEGIALDPAASVGAITPLLERDDLGRIWLIVVDEVVAGYIALGFGYSIEFAGRDAFVDEFFIQELFRGRGIGRAVLDLVAAQARALGIGALHLEVARSNGRAQRLYAAAGFAPRSKYQIMTLKLKTP